MTEVESSVELPASSAAIVCRSILYRGQWASRGLHPSHAQFDHYSNRGTLWLTFLAVGPPLQSGFLSVAAV